MRLKLWAANNPHRLLDLVPGITMGQMFMPTSFLRKIISSTHADEGALQNCHRKPIHMECFPVVFKVNGKSPMA